MSQNAISEQKQHSTVRCDEGAKGHGTVVFAVVTTVPCSGLLRKPSKSSELFEGSFWPERWNVVTTRYFQAVSVFYKKDLISRNNPPDMAMVTGMVMTHVRRML